MALDQTRGHLDTLVLAVLAGGALHGYAVITELKSQSNDTFDLPEGSIYPCLHRLERKGLISSDWAAAAGRRRRVYQLTATGARTLQEERTAWRRYARGVEAILGGAR